MSDDFIFYPSFFESAQIWGKERELEILRSIIRYGSYNEIPDNMSKECEMALRLAIPVIDSSQKRRKGGQKGGRPTSKPTSEPMVKTNGLNLSNNHTEPMVSSLPSREGRREKVEEGRLKEEKEKEKNKICSEVIELFKNICTTLPTPKGMSDQRRSNIMARVAEGRTLDEFREAFENINRSDFHSGRDGKWTNCTFDWIMKPSNFLKALELVQQPSQQSTGATCPKGRPYPPGCYWCEKDHLHRGPTTWEIDEERIMKMWQDLGNEENAKLWKPFDWADFQDMEAAI